MEKTRGIRSPNPFPGDSRRRPSAPDESAGSETGETYGSGFYDEAYGAYGPESPKASGYLSTRWFRREREVVLETVERALGSPAASGPIVDLGCGVGLMTEPLVRRGRRVVGLDFNGIACEAAAGKGLLGVRGDTFHLPFRDRVFALSMTIEVLQQHDADAVTALVAEAARVLRPGGKLVVVWPNRRAWFRRAAILAAALFDRLRGRVETPVRHYPPERILSAAAAAGLRPELRFAFFPWLALRFEMGGGGLASVFGTNFAAVFSKPPAAPPSAAAGEAGNAR